MFYEGKLSRFLCRINGIDTPELRSDDDNERKKAILAKNKLISLCLNKIVWINVASSSDKYGRLLIDIYTDSLEQKKISDILIKDGLAYKYYGGTKKKFSEWCHDD